MPGSICRGRFNLGIPNRRTGSSERFFGTVNATSVCYSADADAHWFGIFRHGLKWGSITPKLLNTGRAKHLKITTGAENRAHAAPPHRL